MREKKLASKLKANTLVSEETAQEVDEETAALELEKLQRKVAREERRKRREIEQEKQKKAIWLLPSLLFVTMLICWLLANFQTPWEVPAIG